MAEQRSRTVKGRLYKRDAKGCEHPENSRARGTYWLQYTVNGKRVRQKLLDPVTKEPITALRDARKLRDDIIAPFTTNNEIERLKSLRAAVTDAEERHQEALESARDKLFLDDAWDAFTRSQERPDSSPATLQQYSYQWGQFVTWLRKHAPDFATLAETTSDHAGGYVNHLQDSGLSAGTVNKHARLCRLVFRVLGPREGMSTNPFDNIKSKKEVQNHRRELAWDKLCDICDRAEAEMKLLLHLGIYTGQRLGDCCLLSWEQVDLMRGWILITPRKTSRRNGRELHIPIHPALRDRLEDVPPERRTGFVLPELAKHYQVSRDRVTNRIRTLFTNCGVQVQKPGTGRYKDPATGKMVSTGKRAVLQYGFHSLRHTTVTLLQEAGVPQAVVQEIVGHRTVAMTQRYTHIGRESLQKAMAKLPPPKEGSASKPQEELNAKEPLPDWVREELKAMTAENWQKVRDGLFMWRPEAEIAHP